MQFVQFLDETKVAAEPQGPHNAIGLKIESLNVIILKLEVKRPNSVNKKKCK